jgi:hypothetical protein
VCTLTIAATIGDLIEQKKIYDSVCYEYGCISFYIVEPLVSCFASYSGHSYVNAHARALCFGASFFGFITALLQVLLYQSRRLWGFRFIILNALATLLWIVVITIGWV